MEGTNDIIGGRSMSDALSGLQTEVNTIIAPNVTVVLLTTSPTCYPAESLAIVFRQSAGMLSCPR